MAAYITQVKTLRRQLIRALNATGAFTASTVGGPMLLQEHGSAAIDTTNKWQSQVAGTGVVSIVTQANSRALRMNSAASSDTASASSLAIVGSPGHNTGATTRERFIYTSMNLEFIMRITNVANIDNARFFAGFSATTFALRTTNNVAGFVLASDALNVLSDGGGTETIAVVGSPPTLTAVQKYKVQYTFDGNTNFWVNDALVTAFTNAGNAPAGPLYVTFNTGSEAATGASVMDISDLRWWLDDEV